MSTVGERSTDEPQDGNGNHKHSHIDHEDCETLPETNPPSSRRLVGTPGVIVAKHLGAHRCLFGGELELLDAEPTSGSRAARRTMLSRFTQASPGTASGRRFSYVAGAALSA
jgi:hypothetical protein